MLRGNGREMQGASTLTFRTALACLLVPALACLRALLAAQLHGNKLPLLGSMAY